MITKEGFLTMDSIINFYQQDTNTVILLSYPAPDEYRRKENLLFDLLRIYLERSIPSRKIIVQYDFWFSPQESPFARHIRRGYVLTPLPTFPEKFK